MMGSSTFQKLSSYLGIGLLALGFAALGTWQLHRAHDSRRPVVVTPTVLPLQSVSAPRIALPLKATLRNVKASGRFNARFQAPGQVDGKGKVSTWEVGLLDVDSGGSILVVRGLWIDREKSASGYGEPVTVVGKMMPHQSDDYAEGAVGILSRIDSSLVVGQTQRDLYDGYIIATGEEVAGSEISRIRVTPPVPRTAVPGFYWQHLSYVLIWWFMAGVVLYLPFYQRRVRPQNALDEKEGADGSHK